MVVSSGGGNIHAHETARSDVERQPMAMEGECKEDEIVRTTLYYVGEVDVHFEVSDLSDLFIKFY